MRAPAALLAQVPDPRTFEPHHADAVAADAVLPGNGKLSPQLPGKTRLAFSDDRTGGRTVADDHKWQSTALKPHALIGD